MEGTSAARVPSSVPRWLVALAIGALACTHAGTTPPAAPASHGAAHHAHEAGRVDFPVSCTRAGQQAFTHGITLLHHMTYPQARAAFEEAIATDPKCAMAHWGVAMTLFQPLWPTRPDAEALQRGWDEVQAARALGAPTQRERMLIDAAAAFFESPSTGDYWQRIRRWEAASLAAYEALPDDPEVSLFYALAHLATTPATTISREHADRAAAILLRVYRQNPDHPGAMHYLVHANDVPGREHELLEITNKYESIAPDNPHAIHMPTHIYTRLGDWDGVIRGNLRAEEAALRYPAGPHGEFVWDEFAHAIEYLVYADLQVGDDEAAAVQLKRLHDATTLEPTFKTAFHNASTAARYALERRAWSEAAALPQRVPASVNWDRFPWPEAIVVFARGVGGARSGQLDDAGASLQRLQELEKKTAASGEVLFARNVQTLRAEVEACIADARGDAKRAEELLREAVAIETSTPKHAVTPAPTLPATEMLGDFLLAHERPAEALAQYRRTLELYPRRLNATLGVARAAKAAGDAKGAAAAWAAAVSIASPKSMRPEVVEARRLVK